MFSELIDQDIALYADGNSYEPSGTRFVLAGEGLSVPILLLFILGPTIPFLRENNYVIMTELGLLGAFAYCVGKGITKMDKTKTWVLVKRTEYRPLTPFTNI